MTTTTTDDIKIILQKGKRPDLPSMMSITATRPLFTIGITGGFAPPTPNAVYTVTRAADSDVFTVSIQLRPHGTPKLLPATTKELRVADHAESIATLQALLCDLPPQYPGAEDLYGRNTSIVTNLRSPEDLYRVGTAAGYGVPRPTEEQKVLFDQAVAIIEGWAA